MAAWPPPIPDHLSVFRGMSNSNWVKNGTVQFKAFMLRPASSVHPPEEELSLGLTPQSAVDELREHHGAAALSVGTVHIMQHNLSVRLDPENGSKARMFGLPIFSTNSEERGRAITIATDLARVSVFTPVPQLHIN
jgi:hypothetical protein